MNNSQPTRPTKAGRQTADLDIHAELAEQGAVAIVWCIDDVRSVRPDLSSEQAWDVLIRCRDQHDCEWGFTWNYLKDVAELLYPVSAANHEEE